MGESPITFRARLEAAGLGPHADQLVQLARPGIRLLPQRMADTVLGIGQSRLGGNPDLPSSTEWPEYKGVPQSFIAQVNLAEVHRYDQEGRLPRAGVLSFFYDAEQSVWGFDPAQDGAWGVLYAEASVGLARREFPDALPEYGRFRPITLRPEAESVYARSELSELDALGLSPYELATYDELIEEDGGPNHMLLGAPQSNPG